MNLPMPDVINPAPTARSKCRACGLAIAKGALRFGEADTNPYGEGESFRWFHLRCAALRRPERLGPALEMPGEGEQPELPDREQLLTLVKQGLDQPRLTRLARVSRAPSGRAQCRHCREAIPKGEPRAELEFWEEGRFSAGGFTHARCASGYFETNDLLERIQLLTPDFSAEDRQTWTEELAKPAPPRVEVPEKSESSEEAET
jgi:hypothetical protein